MVDLIVYAIPAFVLLLAVEFFSFRFAAREDLKGYEANDTRASLSMGLGNVIINAGCKLVVLVIFAGLYELTPLRIAEEAGWAWALLFVLDDFAYYWFHRITTKCGCSGPATWCTTPREHFNLSTALRQTWVPMTYFPFWMPLALLGFPPWMIFTLHGGEPDVPVLDPHRADRTLWGRSSSCSTRRPTTACTTARTTSTSTATTRGILIIWDRLFGTFLGEEERAATG